MADFVFLVLACIACAAAMNALPWLALAAAAGLYLLRNVR